jgi:hypothetical protein
MSAAEEHFVERMMMMFWEAYRENPRMLKAMAEICIRFRRGNEKEAQECLANYLEWRAKTFGGLHDHCITEDRKMLAQLKSNFLRLSPGRLKDGSAILYMSMKDHQPWMYSTAETIKCIHFYLVAAMMVDPDLARAGIFFVINMAKVNFKNFDTSFSTVIASSLGRCVPVRLRSIVMINAPLMVKCAIAPIRAALPKKIVDRLHIVENNEIPHLLNVPKKHLPIEMGGSLKFDAEYDMQQLIAFKWCV